MLPRDAQNRRDAASANEQTRLDSHLKELPLKEKVLPYTDKLFCDVAIEWLVLTDQVRDFNWLILQRSITHSKFGCSQFGLFSTLHSKR